MAIDITLTKAKYRNRNWRYRPELKLSPHPICGYTKVYTPGRSVAAKPRTNSPVKDAKTLKPRRRAYGPF